MREIDYGRTPPRQRADPLFCGTGRESAEGPRLRPFPSWLKRPPADGSWLHQPVAKCKGSRRNKVY